MKHLKPFSLNENSNEDRAREYAKYYGYFNLSNASYTAEEIQGLLRQHFPSDPVYISRVYSEVDAGRNYLEVQCNNYEDAKAVYELLTGDEVRAVKSKDRITDDGAIITPIKYH